MYVFKYSRYHFYLFITYRIHLIYHICFHYAVASAFNVNFTIRFHLSLSILLDKVKQLNCLQEGTI